MQTKPSLVSSGAQMRSSRAQLQQQRTVCAGGREKAHLQFYGGVKRVVT